MAAATAKATDVKKPKTFWTRTRLECMFDRGLDSTAVTLKVAWEHSKYKCSVTRVEVRCSLGPWQIESAGIPAFNRDD